MMGRPWGFRKMQNAEYSAFCILHSDFLLKLQRHGDLFRFLREPLLSRIGVGGQLLCLGDLGGERAEGG